MILYECDIPYHLFILSVFSRSTVFSASMGVLLLGVLGESVLATRVGGEPLIHSHASSDQVVFLFANRAVILWLYLSINCAMIS